MNPLTQFKKIPILPLIVALALLLSVVAAYELKTPFLDWNAYAGQRHRRCRQPAPSARAIRLAMVHVAIYDAVNAIEGYPFTPYAVTPNVVTPASPGGGDCGGGARPLSRAIS